MVRSSNVRLKKLLKNWLPPVAVEFLKRQLVRPTTFHECAECRRLDSVHVQVERIRQLLDLLSGGGISVRQFKDHRLNRFLIHEDDWEQTLQTLSTVDSEKSLRWSTTTVPLNLILYEYDSVLGSEISTFQTVTLRIPPHCSHGAEYLSRPVATLESFQTRGETAVLCPKFQGAKVLPLNDLPFWAAESVGGMNQRDWPFEVDLVYTWVDAVDYGWQLRRAIAESEALNSMHLAANASRFHSRDELRFSLRSAHQYAPWFRKIWIVTDGQKPEWLVETDRIRVVSHAELYPDPDDLPTFNSSGIETVLHRIPGLADQFVYLNDDFFFSAPLGPQDFFSIGGLTKTFPTNRFTDRLPTSSENRPTVASHKNSRELVKQETGLLIDQKYRHAPYVFRKSVLSEMESAFHESFRSTRRSRFRSPDDIAVTSLYQNYSEAKGYAFRSKISARYLEVVSLTDHGLASLSKSAVAFFCLNDTGGTAETAWEKDLELSSWLAARFPCPGPWEKSHSAASLGQAYPAERKSKWHEVVKTLGDTEAADYFARLIRNPSVAKQAVGFFQAVGKASVAVSALQFCGFDSQTAKLRELTIRSHQPDWSTINLLQLGSSLWEREKLTARSGLNQLVRSINTKQDHNAFFDTLTDLFPRWQTDFELVKLAASSARRGHQYDLAKELLIIALELAATHSEQIDRRRESVSLRLGPQAINDFLDVAKDLGEHLFLDAGTLLGAIRDGKLIEHDYDVDFGTKNQEVFEELNWKLRRDWRFFVYRIRSPDKLIQARHVSGVNIDLFLHREKEGRCFKESHVYGWAFDNFELRPMEFLGRPVMVPDPAELYLQQMYGEDWRIPIKSFDSRVSAPNCFFPSHDEIICTQLGKLVAAVMYGDTDAVEARSQFLERELGFKVA